MNLLRLINAESPKKIRRKLRIKKLITYLIGVSNSGYKWRSN